MLMHRNRTATSARATLHLHAIVTSSDARMGTEVPTTSSEGRDAAQFLKSAVAAPAHHGSHSRSSIDEQGRILLRIFQLGLQVHFYVYEE